VAVIGGILVLVAMRRMRSERLELEPAAAVPGVAGAETAAETAVEPPVRSPVPTATTPPELQAPRWLRPSVRAARFESDHVKAPRPGHARRTFAEPPAEGTDRLIVRFDLVQALDRPDEALGVPQEELNTGDEVDVVDRDDEAIWTLVRTPTGRAGWIPALTLASPAAVADETEADSPMGPEVDAATAPDDQPALETLLALAAERRTQIAAPSPGAPDERREARREAVTPSRSERRKKVRKAIRPAFRNRN
jgi:hypothetical protein